MAPTNRRVWSTVLSVCVIIALLAAMGFSAYAVWWSYRYLRFDQKVLKTDQNQIVITLQYNSNPFSLPDTPQTFQTLEALYEDLSENDAYTYLELYEQFVYLADSLPFGNPSDPNENGLPAVNAIQISQATYDYFELSVEEGRAFEEKDFYMEKGEAIPVLLGAAFEPYHNVGDKIRGEYLFYSYTFQVIGFLSPDSQIVRGWGSLFKDVLSECVVMPEFAFEWSPETKAEYDHQKLHWVNRVSGKIYVEPEQASAVTDWLEDRLSRAELGEFWIMQSINGQQEFALGLTLRQFVWGGVFLFLLSLCAVVWIAWKQIKKRREFQRR